jgi:hypothetical protein
MDPLVEVFHRSRPMDHSLDGLPVTVTLVGLVGIVLTTLALRLTGRSWKVWHFSGLAVWAAWWAGTNVGRSGFRGAGIMATVVLLVILIEPARMMLRAALVPVERNGRR